MDLTNAVSTVHARTAHSPRCLFAIEQALFSESVLVSDTIGS